MDPRLLRYYNRELQFVQEMGAEFAEEYPKIASRLGMATDKVSDPYVERLLESFAFLAARVHLKIDSQFPNFTQHLLEIVYPHYLSPLPSMAIAELSPILEESALVEGFVLPRDTALQSQRARGEKTACTYRTGHEVRFWPIEVTEARYFNSAGALATIGVDRLKDARAGIRLSLRTAGGVAFDQLPLNSLRFFLKGKDSLPWKLYEQLLGNACEVMVRPKGGVQATPHYLGADSIKAVGFDEAETLLPNPRRSFAGYRYLQEYFGFPERYLFVDFEDLLPSVSDCASTELEIVILLKQRDSELDGVLDASNFALNCAPIINLFPKRTDRIHLDDRNHEYHVLPDRTRPMDFEVWAVSGVQGFGSGTAPEQTFEPLYAHHDSTLAGASAFFTVKREPRALSSKQRRQGRRSPYIGGEVYVSLVDPNEAPYRGDLRQVEVMSLCTNRDLPQHLNPGQGQTDFTLDTGAPIGAIRCIAGPTTPKPSFAHGDTAWRLISHLSLNYLSLTETDPVEGAVALRSLLELYVDNNDAGAVRQVEGLKSIESRPINGRIPAPGPITFGRGLEITLTCEEGAFEGTGLFLFGQVMEAFFAKYVSLNSFTQTVLRSTDRGEIMRWPTRIGQRRVL